MPIPTRTQPLTSRSNVAPSNQNQLPRRTTALSSAAGDKEKSEAPARRNDAPSNAAAVTRVLPRPTTKPLLRSAGHTRAASTTSAITKTTSAPRAPTARVDSGLPSSVSRPSGHNRQQGTSVSSKISSINTGHTRAASTTATPSARSAAALSSRTKPSAESHEKKSKDDLSSGAATRSAVNPKGVASSDPSRLHEELLQLRILHEAALPNLEQYRQSTEKFLSEKTEQLRRQQDRLLDLEAQDREVRSLGAFNQWLNATPSDPSDRRVQLLSSTVVELDKLDDGSDMLAPLRQFEAWFAETLTLQTNRASSQSTHGELVFVKPLGHAWSQRMLNLSKALSAFKSNLNVLGDAEEGSGIGSILERQRRLNDTLIQEVETALEVEKMVVQAEATWEAKELHTAVRQLNTLTEVEQQPAWE